MLVELIEDCMEAQTRKQQQFFELAERFRSASDPEEARRLGDKHGRDELGMLMAHFRGRGFPSHRCLCVSGACR
jgi:hypothetical protein